MTGCNPVPLPTSSGLASFQSTAGPMTGCNLDALCSKIEAVDRHTKFQSTAGPMTGCNPVPLRYQFGPRLVSIHSRPHDRLQPRSAHQRGDKQRVSIHSRPHDRLQRLPDLDYYMARMFQSTAGPMTGCNPFSRATVLPSACFNPQPAP